MTSKFELDNHNLQPKLVWELFDQLRKIPRPSGKEQKVIDWLKQLAQKHNFRHTQDQAGNLCIHVPAHQDYQNAQTVVLQAHADMVTEKRPEKQIDFESDQIDIQFDGEWISAEDTTLGADNGVGLCMALAAAIDPDCLHPPLEILVTIEEETTFKGALEFDPEALEMQGTTIINLDNEEDGAIFISSAGMLKLKATAPLELTHELDPTKSYLKISLTNLPGGHSGAQIHEVHRENAILAMAQFLSGLNPKLLSISGGDKDNAIPRDIFAIIALEPEEALTLLKKPLKTNQGYTFEIEVFTADAARLKIFSENFAERVLSCLSNLPNGVHVMHPEIPDLVQTSSNLASIRVEDGQLQVVVSVRSSIDNEMQETYASFKDHFERHGFTVEMGRLTPGWNGQPNSPIVNLATQAYQELTGKPALVKAIHAGLEVGQLTATLSTYLNTPVQAISFGPTILDAHTPQERVKVRDVETAYKQLLVILEKLAKQ